MLARAVLWILGLSFIGFGLWALLSPASIAQVLTFDLTTVQAKTEMRAFYGGVELGFGAFLITCALRPDHINTALTAGMFVLGMIAVSRIIGLVLDGSGSQIMYIALSSEILGAIACWWALHTRRR